MESAGKLIVRYSNRLLNNKRDALIFVSIFAMLPFTAWLTVSLVALVTLRKGKEAGLNLLLPAMIAHLVSLMTAMSLEAAIVSALITYIPVYLAAGILRAKANWSLVFGSFMFQAFLGIVLIQCFAPDSISVQYGHFQSMMAEMPLTSQIVQTREYLAKWDQAVLAHVFFGIQLLVIGCLALIALLLARFIQSALFIPGGFKKEIAAFRSGKSAVVVLLLSIVAAYFKITYAIDILPLMLAYFLLSGLNLLLAVLAQKKTMAILFFIVSLIASPFTMMMICCIFGILDSLFNFRIYFPAKAGNQFEGF